MIEGSFSLVGAIVDFFVSLFGMVIEFIGSFFVAAGETLAVSDVFLVLFVFLAEILLWLKELILSLFNWRKPYGIKKPVFWRPKPKLKDKEI